MSEISTTNRLEYNKNYKKTQKGIASDKKYRESPKGIISNRKASKKYYYSDKGQKHIKNYHETKDWKISQEKYKASDKAKTTKKKWKEKNPNHDKDHSKKFRLENPEYQKEWNKNNQEHVKQYSKQYRLNNPKTRHYQDNIELQLSINNVKKRDNNTCKWYGCGLTKREAPIHVHHIFPRNEYPELELIEQYMICYCFNHHVLFHRYRGDSYSEFISARNSIVINHIIKEINNGRY